MYVSGGGFVGDNLVGQRPVVSMGSAFPDA
jgi:dipeptide/tripeptide permease